MIFDYQRDHCEAEADEIRRLEVKEELRLEDIDVNLLEVYAGK